MRGAVEDSPEVRIDSVGRMLLRADVDLGKGWSNEGMGGRSREQPVNAVPAIG